MTEKIVGFGTGLFLYGALALLWGWPEWFAAFVAVTVGVYTWSLMEDEG